MSDTQATSTTHPRRLLTAAGMRALSALMSRSAEMVDLTVREYNKREEHILQHILQHMRRQRGGKPICSVETAKQAIEAQGNVIWDDLPRAGLCRREARNWVKHYLPAMADAGEIPVHAIRAVLRKHVPQAYQRIEQGGDVAPNIPAISPSYRREIEFLLNHANARTIARAVNETIYPAKKRSKK